jgi:hypothetical protein
VNITRFAAVVSVFHRTGTVFLGTLIGGKNNQGGIVGFIVETSSVAGIYEPICFADRAETRTSTASVLWNKKFFQMSMTCSGIDG